MFENYPDITAVDAPEQVLESSAMDKEEKKAKKHQKWMKKQMKRQTKALEALRNYFIGRNASVEETPSAPKKDAEGKKATSFLSRLGDAIIKAIPTILTTVVTAVLGFFFKGNMGSRSRKLGGAMA